MECQYEIVPELYDILVYDIESNGTTITEQPAYITSTSIVSSPTPSLTVVNPARGPYNFVVIIVIYYSFQ